MLVLIAYVSHAVSKEPTHAETLLLFRNNHNNAQAKSDASSPTKELYMHVERMATNMR